MMPTTLHSNIAFSAILGAASRAADTAAPSGSKARSKAPLLQQREALVERADEPLEFSSSPDVNQIDVVGADVQAAHTDQWPETLAQAPTDGSVASAQTGGYGLPVSAGASADVMPAWASWAVGGVALAGIALASGGGKAAVSSDRTPPTLDVQMGSAAPEVGKTMRLTFIFSEDVTGFHADDIQVGGASKGDFKVINARTYALDVTPSDAAKLLQVGVAPGAARDLAGNGYEEGLQLETTVLASPMDPPFKDNFPPVFMDGPSMEVSVEKNSVGPIHEVRATDDSGPVYFAFAEGVNDNELFTLDPLSGLLSLMNPLDFESQGATTLRVQITATDSVGNSALQHVVVHVKDQTIETSFPLGETILATCDDQEVPVLIGRSSADEYVSRHWTEVLGSSIDVSGVESLDKVNRVAELAHFLGELNQGMGWGLDRLVAFEDMDLLGAQTSGMSQIQSVGEQTSDAVAPPGINISPLVGAGTSASHLLNSNGADVTVHVSALIAGGLNGRFFEQGLPILVDQTELASVQYLGGTGVL